MSNYMKGDLVRVTAQIAPDTSIVGHVVEAWKVSGYDDVKVTFLGNFLSVNSRNCNIEVLSRVEPEELGSVYTTDTGTYIKWTASEKYTNNWIEAETAMWTNWKEILG